MTRLIDADALEEKLQYVYSCDYIDSKSKEGVVSDIIDEIDNAPTVEERPQGEWEIVDAEGGKIWNCVCTECGHDPQEYIGGTEDWWLRKPLPNYCPNCGVSIVNVRGDYE